MLTDTLNAFTDEVATSLLAAITVELAPTGLALTLLSSTEHGELIPARDVPMDGAFVYSCRTSSTAAEWLKKRKLPLVFIDNATVKGYSSVNIDDRGGARAAAQHLVDLGHRRIAIVNSVLDAPIGAIDTADILSGGNTAATRMLGWLDALRPAGVVPRVVNAGRTSEEGGIEAARTLFDAAGSDRPTAVLCFSDLIAAGVIAHANACDLRVPDDLSVVGFDDASLARRGPVDDRAPGRRRQGAGGGGALNAASSMLAPDAGTGTPSRSPHETRRAREHRGATRLSQSDGERPSARRPTASGEHASVTVASCAR